MISFGFASAPTMNLYIFAFSIPQGVIIPSLAEDVNYHLLFISAVLLVFCCSAFYFIIFLMFYSILNHKVEKKSIVECYSNEFKGIQTETHIKIKGRYLKVRGFY